MFNIVAVGWLNVLTGLILSLSLIILSIVLFKFVWIQKHDFHFPRGKT